MEKEKVRAKMQLAVRLDELIKAAGLSKGEFAARLGKNPSEISKWLSGTHNFTLDTLAEISNAFNIALPELCFITNGQNREQNSFCSGVRNKASGYCVRYS